MLGVKIAAECRVAAATQAAFLVQQLQYANITLEQLHDRLVIWELDMIPTHALTFVFLLYSGKHVPCKLVLELLIRIVDAQLLE